MQTTTLTDEQIDDLARKHCLDGSMVVGKRSDYWRAFARDLIAALASPAEGAAVPAQPTQPQPVGEAGTMPGTSGFTMACFKAAEVPVGTKLYGQPQQVEGAAPTDELREGVRQITATLAANEWAELLSTDPDLAALEAQISRLVGGASAPTGAELVSASAPSEREVMKPFVTEFLAALHGARGDLDAWLEVNDESECRNVIKEAIAAATAEQTRSGAVSAGLSPNVSTLSPEPAKVGGAGELTDADIVAVLNKNGIDTYPSKYGFPETQVSATNVPNIRRVVMGCMNILAAKASGVQAADLAKLQRHFNSEFGVEKFSRAQHKNMPDIPTYFLAADVEALFNPTKESK